MRKSIKLKNDNYWDASSITHIFKVSNDTRLRRKTLAEAINHPNQGLSRNVVLWGADMNTILEYGTGLFQCNQGCTNTPTNSGQANMSWYVIQFADSTTYGVQIATPLWGNVMYLYLRHCIDGTWNAWKKVTFA